MNKIGLIISREYFTRVKKKSFFLTTILVPIIIIGFYAAIIAIAVQGGTDKQNVAVIDETNLLDGKTPEPEKSISLKFIQNETEASFIKKYKDQELLMENNDAVTLTNKGKFYADGIAAALFFE